MEALLQPWLAAVGGGPEQLRAGRELLGRYAEPHRRYHDRLHLAEVLAALRTLAGASAVPAPVVLAGYWHDAVYDPTRDDNEEQSGLLAAATLPELGVPGDVVDEVVRLVRLTATHQPAAGDDAGALLCDADLAILGAPTDRYRAYAAAVRAEYGHLAPDVFRAGRARVLRELAQRRRLFSTDEGHRRWDAPARRNLHDELRALGADRRP